MRSGILGSALALGMAAAFPVEARVEPVVADGCDRVRAASDCEDRTAAQPETVRLANNTDAQNAVIGAALGAIVAGSIIAATDQHSHKSGHHHKDWWSPAAGVKCYDRDSVCHHDGHFAPKWTRRAYGY